MIPPIDINEVWSYRPNPSDLFNIERSINPANGGGARYIQIRKSQLSDLLLFLGLPDVPDEPVAVTVRSHFEPDKTDEIVFTTKSQQRMRIANQNRHFANRARGWSPSQGFPTLERTETTADAARIIDALGGLHIYLVRDAKGVIWAGFTKGSTPTSDIAGLPFAELLFGSSDGGYWRFGEGNRE